MNLLLMVLTVASGLSPTLDAPASVAAQATRADIDVAELKRRMAEDEVVLIDV